MRKYVKQLAIVLSSLLLSGCFSAVKLKPASAYMLNTLPEMQAKLPHPVSLLVLPPESESAYDTAQMAYSIAPYQIAYYNRNRWAETPGQMLHPLMVRTLQNTHYFHAVIASPAVIGRYNYVLNTRVLQLQQDYTHRPAVVRLNVRAQLVRATTAQVVATKEFIIQVPMRRYTPYGGVLAANAATGEFLEELAIFTMRHAR